MYSKIERCEIVDMRMEIIPFHHVSSPKRGRCEFKSLIKKSDTSYAVLDTTWLQLSLVGNFCLSFVNNIS